MTALLRNIEESVVDACDYDKASKDIGVRLISIAKTLRKVSGGSLSAIGTTSGRIAATHLPRMFEDVNITFDDILKDLQKKWKSSFAFDYILSGSEATLTFKQCPVYNILAKEGEKIGGDLCTLFHCYIQGILVEVLSERLQLKVESMGETCVLKIRVIPKFD